MGGELPLRRRVFFTVITAAFVFFVVEVACQVFYRVTAGDFLFRRTGLPIFEADPTRCYRLKSGLEYAHRTNEFDVVVYANSQGMRTDELRRDVSPEKAPGTYRILFLGPSFTFGWGNFYEDAYPTLIGDLLRNEGKRVEIVNLGTPAQGPEPQICWLEQQAARFEPDMVVQTVYGDRVQSVVGECPDPLSCPVIEDSRIYTTAPTLRRRFIARVKNLGTAFYGYYVYQWILGFVPAGDAGMGKELHGARARQSSDDRGALAADFLRYERLVHSSLGERVQVAYLFVPMSYVVHPEDASRWRHLLEADPMGSRERIRQAVSALRQEGLAVIDPTEELVRRGADERLYYWLDIHLTPLGNRVVAEQALPPLLEIMESARP
jgi:hypothetical protein